MRSEPTSPRRNAAVVGALLTPPGAGLSLQLWPLVAPALLFALVGLFLGYRSPRLAWRVGLWMGVGLFLICLTLGVIVLGILVATGGGLADVDAGTFDFARVTLLLVGLPGLVGGCLGGWCGALLARRRADPTTRRPTHKKSPV